VSVARNSNNQIENIKDANEVEADRAQREEVKTKVKIAREILADKSIPDVLRDTHSEKFAREAHIVVTIFALLVAGLLIAWYLWKDEYLSNEYDLIYNMGLVGGIMMLLQFIYTARKRSKKMRRWGELKVWFGIHTFIGLSAPTIIVFHSRFELQSINASVAFIAMIIVVFSGIVGRYLYSQVKFDLTTNRNILKNIQTKLNQQVLKANASIAGEIEKLLKGFMVMAFVTPKNSFQAVSLLASIEIRSRIVYIQITQLKNPANNNGKAISHNTRTFDGSQKQILRDYINLLSKIARNSAYQQLFALWRIGHVPVIYLLLVTALAHVLAVHMY